MSQSTLNKQKENQLTQQHNDSLVKGKVHLHALLIISLEKHNCDAACDHHPNVVMLRRVQFVSAVRQLTSQFIVLLKSALTMFALAKRCTQWLLLVFVVQGCV